MPPPGSVLREVHGKVFSLRSVVRFRVERRDHGTIVTCEATHPALGGQRRQTQYMLDVQCEWGALGGGYGGYGGFGVSGGGLGGWVGAHPLCSH